MKDAYGGIVNLVFIVVFLLLVSGILGMTVNYTKAFRMKNAVLSTIENFQGYGCGDKNDTAKTSNTHCRERIKENAAKLGYSPPHLKCPSEYNKVDKLYCIREKNDTPSGVKIYQVVTQVDINIPIINRMMGMHFFQINGETKPIER